MANDHFRDIRDVRYQYSEGIDQMDWDLYRSVFCDDIQVAMMAEAGTPLPEWNQFRADDWVAYVSKLVSGLAATQHCMFNHRLTMSEGTATLMTYMQAEHFLDFEHDDSWYTIGGYYLDGLRLTDDGWKISTLELFLYWHRGNPAVLAQAEKRGASGRPAPRVQLPRGPVGDAR